MADRKRKGLGKNQAELFKELAKENNEQFPGNSSDGSEDEETNKKKSNKNKSKSAKKGTTSQKKQKPINIEEENKEEEHSLNSNKTESSFFSDINEEISDEKLNEKLDEIMNKITQIDIAKEIGSKFHRKESRIIISEIILENFKSYADKVVIGPLHYRFNSIVGPNGSGKSNLMESLLFVFGKRASKMRLKKLSELIHSSANNKNNKKGNPTSAKVTIKFCEILDDTNDNEEEKDNKDNNINNADNTENQDNNKLININESSNKKSNMKTSKINKINKPSGQPYTIIPNSNFSIARAVYRNSSSKYYLNSRESSFEEINKLLNTKGIDLKHNRFLILQGEVEQISLMKPKAQNENEVGLLEFLEDIIGTRRYVPLITKLSKSIDVLNEIRGNKLSRVKIAKENIKNLEDVKNQSLDYYKNEKSLLILKHLGLEIEKNGVSTKKQTVQTQVDLKSQEINELNQKMKEKVDFYKQTVANNGTLNNELGKLKAKREELKIKAKDYEAKDKMNQDQIENCVKNKKKADAELEKLNKKLSSNNDEIVKAREAHPKLKEAVDELNARYKELENELEKKEKEAYEQTKILQNKKKEVENKLRPFDSKIIENNTTLEQNSKLIEILKSKISNRENEFNTLSNKEKEIESNTQQRENTLNDLNKRKQDVQNKIKDLDKRLNDTENLLKNKQKEVQEKSIRLSEFRNNKNDNEVKDRILQALLTAQREAKIRGFYGRLGDLGCIDGRYDIAISTSCPQLDNLVVDNAENGKNIINYLKKNNIGWATFIIVDKVKECFDKFYKQNYQCPTNYCKRLIDLIKIKDQSLLPAFYFAVRDTLVTDSLEHANTIAYGKERKRVVTIDGNIIEISGAMIGGGRPKRGKMGTVIKNYALENSNNKANNNNNVNYMEEQNRLTNEYQQSVNEFNELRNQQSNLMNEQKSNNKILQDIEANLSKVENEQLSMAKSLKEIKENLRSLKNDEELNKNEKIKLNDFVNKNNQIENENENLRNQSQELRDEYEEIKSNLNNAFGEDYNMKKDEKNKLKKQINEKERELRKTENTLDNAEDSINKIQNQIKEKEDTKNEIDSDIKKYQNEMKTIEEEAMKVLQEMNDNEKAIEDKTKEIGEGAQEMEKLKNEVREMVISKKKKEEELNEIKDDLKKYEIEEKAFNERIDNNKDEFNKLINEFGFIEDLEKEIKKLLKNEGENGEEAKDKKDNKEAEGDNNKDLNENESNKSNNVNDNDDNNAKKNENPNNNDDESSNNNNAESIILKEEEESSVMIHSKHFGKYLNKKELQMEFSNEEMEVLTKYIEEIRQLQAESSHVLAKLQPNLSSIQAYKEQLINLKNKKDDLNATTEKLDKANSIFNNIKGKRLDEFMEGFSIINQKLSEIYRKISRGGDAELELADSLDPFNEGITFSVRPNKKSWKSIINLSGGEKTLSSLSLIFALHKFKPSPLYVMDEIDAALDVTNVSVIADFVKERTLDSQFLIISLRNQMFENAMRLIGIYKTFEKTKTCVFWPFTDNGNNKDDTNNDNDDKKNSGIIENNLIAGNVNNNNILGSINKDTNSSKKNISRGSTSKKNKSSK